MTKIDYFEGLDIPKLIALYCWENGISINKLALDLKLKPNLLHAIADSSYDNNIKSKVIFKLRSLVNCNSEQLFKLIENSNMKVSDKYD